MLSAHWAGAFNPNTTSQPSDHHPIVPIDGSAATLNPPAMVWRQDLRADTYIVEISKDQNFPRDDSLIRIEGVAFPFYNHNATLSPGTWYWRYFAVRKNGEVSNPGPVRSFVITDDALPMPMPSMEQVFASLPEHPRMFITQDNLEAFRAKRNGAGKNEWDALRFRAERALRNPFEVRGRSIPIAEAQIVPSAESIGHSHYRPGQIVRRQVFSKNANGELFWLPDNHINFLKGDAERLETLSLAWQISGDERYLQGARRLIAMLAPLRLDAHLDDNQRAEHDTVCYSYEDGLKGFAVAYDRLYNELSEEEKKAMLEHVEFHAEAAGQWLKKNTIDTTYQISHPQKTMHALLTTVLAMAGDSPIVDKWTAYVLPQYMNRIAWTSPDGGYFEGQAYSFRFGSVLESLLAIRSVTGVDLFKKPEIYKAGAYWLYAMNLNYWFHHWGDNMSLIWPYASARDAFTSGILSSMNNDPYLKWYSVTMTTNPEGSPFGFDYIASGELPVRPPIDIAQARAFQETGTLVAYNGLYDHNSERIFFRSSPWGAHSHAHADQNAFVIHAGGEILAPDTGYYTYYGDDHHMKWSKSTFAHNSMLVNGKPQPVNIDSKGKIANFFHAARLTYFVGDASEAYEKPLNTFRRAVLYVRPGTYVVYDELGSDTPSTYSWLLNVFQEPQIDEKAKSILVPQRHMRLQADTLLPQSVRYVASNKRPYPMKQADKPWSRFSEAFPQPWHIRVENAIPAKDESFLTLLQTWNVADGARERAGAAIATGSTVGLSYKSASETATVLFRRKLENGNGSDSEGTLAGSNDVIISGENLRAKGQAAALFRSAAGATTSWLLASGSALAEGEALLFHSTFAVNASASFDFAAAAALIRIDGHSGRTSVRLSEKPRQLFAAPPYSPQQARELAFSWDEAASAAVFTLDGKDASLAIWVDPVVDLAAPLPKSELRVSDSGGDYTIPLEPAWMENGQIMYFGRITPREVGAYAISAVAKDAGAVSLLVQDHWDPHERSARGQGSVSGVLRESSWLYFSAPPQTTPHFTAKLEQPLPKGAIDDILFNGDFEAGIPGYPPRHWIVSFRLLPDDSLSWFHWTQEDARSGESAVRYIRDHDNYELVSRPMRLQSDGEYHLRFYARGDIDNAHIIVRGSQNQRIQINIKPSVDWQLYEASGKLPAGHTDIAIIVPDGPKGQELWVDGIQFGKIPNP